MASILANFWHSPPRWRGHDASAASFRLALGEEPLSPLVHRSPRTIGVEHRRPGGYWSAALRSSEGAAVEANRPSETSGLLGIASWRTPQPVSTDRQRFVSSRPAPGPRRGGQGPPTHHDPLRGGARLSTQVEGVEEVP
jgi:hypothetical protein